MVFPSKKKNGVKSSLNFERSFLMPKAKIKKSEAKFCRSALLLSFCETPFVSIAINKKVKFDEARCPFSTFLRLQGASPRWSPLRMRTKVVSFFNFFQELSNTRFHGHFSDFATKSFTAEADLQANTQTKRHKTLDDRDGREWGSAQDKLQLHALYGCCHSTTARLWGVRELSRKTLSAKSLATAGTKTDAHWTVCARFTPHRLQGHRCCWWRPEGLHRPDCTNFQTTILFPPAVFSGQEVPEQHGSVQAHLVPERQRHQLWDEVGSAEEGHGIPEHNW